MSTQAPLQLVRPTPQVRVQKLLLQTSFALQVFRQLPQFLGSLRVSTQMPLQDSSGAGQKQLLLMQGWPGPHLVPQAPQLSGLFLRSVQKPLQLTWPTGHWLMHLLPTQASPVAQSTLQPPQLKRSVVVSTQAVPHCLRPGVQPATHFAA